MVSQWNLNKLFMTRTYDYVNKLDLSFIPFYSHVIELDKLFFPCLGIVNFESIFLSYVKNCVIFKHTLVHQLFKYISSCFCPKLNLHPWCNKEPSLLQKNYPNVHKLNNQLYSNYIFCLKNIDNNMLGFPKSVKKLSLKWKCFEHILSSKDWKLQWYSHKFLCDQHVWQHLPNTMCNGSTIQI